MKAMSQPVPPALLSRLAEHAARMDRIADSSIATVIADINERDARGDIIHVMHSVSRVERVQGRSITRVVQATRDGRDYRAAAQKRADEQDRARKKESPFAASQQSNYRFVLLGADRVSFEPVDSGHLHPEAVIGEAAIDPAAGECIRLSGRPAKYGPLVERAEFSFEYNGRTPQGRMLSAMTLEYAGGLLFVRKQGDVAMTFAFAAMSAE